jgi:light-regulated signal transduction histidine kinase (bacteriophytochrome)
MDDIEVLKRKIEREKAARLDAENILEQKSLELYQANQELLKYIEQVDKVNEELNNFAHIVSHDLKAPLRSIHSLATWLVQDNIDQLSEEGKEQLQLLMGRVITMSDLIDAILAYSRIGRTEEKKIEVDLNLLVNEVLALISPPAHIEINILNKLPIMLCPRVKMHQVFQNLLSNAIKYMDKPAGIVNITAVDEKTHWVFGVSDNGPGIDKKYHDKIFQVFQTISTNKNKDSTGIGLSIVKKIIESEGGRIWVESAVGEGSTFFFSVPV